MPVAIENLPSGRGQRTFASITDVAGLYRDTWQMLRQWLRFGGLSLQPKQQLSPRLPLVLKGMAWLAHPSRCLETELMAAVLA